MTTFYFLRFETPPTPKNRVVKLYPRALGSHFVATYVSQGYGGGIRTGLHKVAFILKSVRIFTLWYVNPSLGNGRARSNYTTAVVR
jgi:hypothetical protein